MLKNTLIIAPLEPELNPVINQLKILGLSFEKSILNKQPVYKCLEKPVVLATSGLGKVEMALKVSELHKLYKFESVLGIGSCGSLNPDLKLGSFHLIESGTEHDFKTCLGSNIQYPNFETSTGLTQKIKSRLHIGVTSVASGDETINSPERAQALRDNHPKAQIVTWETAGLARACNHLQLPWAEIRMISDYCDLSNFAEFRKKVKSGMPKLADMLLKLF